MCHYCSKAHTFCDFRHPKKDLGFRKSNAKIKYAKCLAPLAGRRLAYPLFQNCKNMIKTSAAANIFCKQAQRTNDVVWGLSRKKTRYQGQLALLK